jgi:8-oxo-dGTP diphosphatase
VTVRAAGGVVWRRGPRGVEVLLVHRPKYDDWSLPKGKCAHAGERDEACARREVLEETGLACALGAELPTTSYVDNDGRPKRVRYWAMEAVDGRFEPNAEVDEIRWVAVADAPGVLTHARDADVVAAAAAIVSSGAA